MQLSSVIPEEYQGHRIDSVLASLFPDYSRMRLTSWLKSGYITINHDTYKPKDRVQGGELVHINVPSPSLETSLDKAEAIPLTIAYEDEHLLIVNKPADLIVHPGAGNPKHTLVNALLHHEPTLSTLPRAGIIHRLDKDTTGLLLVAKTLRTHTALQKAMQERQIDRRYLALVRGHIIAGNTIETYYGRDPRNRLKMAVCQNGRTAITSYTVDKHFGQLTLLRINLLTGRTHQIRVHMAHIRHPIIGDQLYGGSPFLPRDASPELIIALQRFKRQALHAYELSFQHPDTQQPISVSAPIPDDFQQLLTLLAE